MDNPILYSDLVSPGSGEDPIVRLINELQALQTQYKANIDQIKQGATDLANSLKNVNGATEQGRQQMQQSAKQTEDFAHSWHSMTDAMRENLIKQQEIKAARREATQMAKLEAKLRNEDAGSYNALSAAYSKLKIELNGMSRAERELTAEGRKKVAQAKDLYEQMKKLQEATGKHQLNVGNYYEGVSKAMKDYANQLPMMIGGNNALFKSFLSLGSSMNGTTSIMGGLSAGLKALGSSLMSLMANPVFLAVAGITAVGAGIKWWYDYNSGIQEATRLTREFTGMVGKDLVDFRSEILAISNTWGKDFKETLQATDAVAANFKISFEEASTAIKDGFQAGADLNGDFLSKLKQYPAYFKEAGLNVRQFVAILTQTRSGIFSDQGLDAIKQANARIREMSKGTADALNAIKIPAEQVQQDLVSGAKTTFDVLQEVSAKLAELPPASQEVGEVLVNVFGKQGRDAGLEMIKSLQDINTNLDEVKKGTGELGELEAKQAEAEKELQIALASLFDQTGGNFERMKANLTIFVKQALTSLINGIHKVINAIIDMYNKSVAFRAIWNGIGAVIKAQVALVTNILVALKDLIVGLGRTLYGVFTFDWDTLKHGVEQFMTALPKMVKAQAQSVGKIVADSINDTINGHIYAKGDAIRNNMIEWAKQNGKHPEKYQNNGESNESDDDGKYKYMSKVAEPSTPTISDASSKTKTTSTPTTKVGKSGKSGSSTRQVDPIKALEDAAKKEWQVYNERLKQYRTWEDSQLVYIENEEALQKRQAQLKYDRQIQDLENTKKYYSQLHQINAQNQWTPEQDKWINDQITALQLERTEALLNIERQFIIKRNELEKDGNEMVLKTLKEGSKEEFELRKRNLELERSTALMQDAMKPIAEQIGGKKINAMYDAELQRIEDEYTQHFLDLYDKEQEYYQSEFDLLEKSEMQKTKYRLKAEKERLQKVLELNEKMNSKMSDVEVATIQNQIKAIDKQLQQTAPQDIYDVFGLSLSDEKKQAIDEAVSYATAALNTFMDSYVKAADAKLQLAEKQVESSKKVLDAEIEARNQGYASDVATAQKELDLARKNQEKAKRQQEKAQKEQLALQAVEQISNLVTASSLIWKQLGFPWAIPALAIMWGSFAYAKVKAASMVGSSEEYGEGTVELLSGGSHQSGNDVDLGTKRDGTKRRAEGGEFFAVINKRNSRRYRKLIPDVINSLNNGTFAGKYLNAYKTDDGLIFNINGSPEELKSISKDVSEIRKRNEHQVYIDGRGNTIEIYRNVKRTIRRDYYDNTNL